MTVFCDITQVRTDAASARLERMLGVLCWLYEVSTLSDGTCRLVCDMLDVPTLVKLIEVQCKNRSYLCRLYRLYYRTDISKCPG